MKTAPEHSWHPLQKCKQVDADPQPWVQTPDAQIELSDCSAQNQPVRHQHASHLASQDLQANHNLLCKTHRNVRLVPQHHKNGQTILYEDLSHGLCDPTSSHDELHAVSSALL